ncbi:MAG: hypothetical protein EFT35_04475 [Methanophagales archaeon ANME-1-THS]|nr:MAG: hypothetical protein EFT35_04475 [Methanophagales archaeon ANME-1-THS]
MTAIRIVSTGILVILLWSVGLTIAQDQSEDLANNGLPNHEEYHRTVHDLLTGDIDRPLGATDYAPPKNLELLPRPVPPIEQDRLVIDQDEGFILPMSPSICAGYQCFGGRWFKPACGRVATTTSTITNLEPEAKEWQVLHQWPTQGENAIVITYYPEAGSNSGLFGIYIGALGGYVEYVYRPASNSFNIGIRPEHQTGKKEYSKISFWVHDTTDGVYWSKTYILPAKQSIKSVDAALEHDCEAIPNELWKNFVEFRALDQNKKSKLKSQFRVERVAMFNYEQRTYRELLRQKHDIRKSKSEKNNSRFFSASSFYTSQFFSFYLIKLSKCGKKYETESQSFSLKCSDDHRGTHRYYSRYNNQILKTTANNTTPRIRIY